MRLGVEPEDAATVILVRENARGIEVYLTQRQDRLAFLGGYHVFPGGKVDDHDRGSGVPAKCRGLSAAEARQILPAAYAPERALGFFVAGVRELFEEAGVLLAEAASDGSGEGLDEETGARLTRLRQELLADRIGFQEVLDQAGLYCSLGRLHWFAHWVTPAFSPRRFNTHFFVARKPEGQEPTPFRQEIDQAVWASPAEAINNWRQGRWKMIPPTISSLDTLSRYPDWEAIEKDFTAQASSSPSGKE